MRIGIDCRMYSDRFTGIGRYVYELIKFLEKNDTENEYVLFFNQPEFEGYIPKNSRFKKVLIGAKHYGFREQIFFPIILYREKIDLMHFTHFNAPIFYFKKSIVTIHDLTLCFYPGKKMNTWYHQKGYRIVLGSILKKAKKIISVSEHTKKDIIEYMNISEEKISVIYNGVNPEFDPKHIPSKEYIDLPLPEKYFLYAGVHRGHKNIVRLIQAYDEFLQEFPDTHLVLAGKEDPHEQEIRAEIGKRKLENKIHILGYISFEKLLHLYKNAHGFIFPSLYEGFGIPVLEAMKAEIPLACSNASSLPEIATKKWAIFFDPFEVNSIARALKQLETDMETRKKMTTFGKKHVLKFSWEKMGKSVHEIYSSFQGKN